MKFKAPIHINKQRTTCVQLITENFEEYRASQLLSSSVIHPDTMKQMMTHLPSETLKNMIDNPNFSFPTAYPNTELEYRKSIYATKLR